GLKFVKAGDESSAVIGVIVVWIRHSEEGRSRNDQTASAGKVLSANSARDACIKLNLTLCREATEGKKACLRRARAVDSMHEAWMSDRDGKSRDRIGTREGWHRACNSWHRACNKIGRAHV